VRPRVPIHTNRWIVDPLDGTTNFLHGIPHFAISIAHETRWRGHRRLVYEPTRDEMFWAEKGIGAYLNDRRLRVSARRLLGEALIGTGIRSAGAAISRPISRPWPGSRRRPAGCAGSARRRSTRLCRGRRYDGFWEFGLSPWDIAAGLLLVREAGGFISDLAGGQTMMTSGDVLAANRHLHLPLAALIREALRTAQAAP